MKYYGGTFWSALIAASLVSTAAFSDEWTCRSEMVTGFAFTGGSWDVSKFEPTATFLVRPLKDIEKGTFFAREDATYGVFPEGSDKPVVDCTDSFEDYILSNGINLGAPGYLYCNNHTVVFSFNRNNLRFMYSLNSGYVNVVPGVNDLTDETSNTPMISIGRCHKL